jgi:hypothetical protein
MSMGCHTSGARRIVHPFVAASWLLTTDALSVTTPYPLSERHFERSENDAYDTIKLTYCFLPGYHVKVSLRQVRIDLTVVAGFGI